MTRAEWFRALGRCYAAHGIHPCQLITTWPAIADYCERRRAQGASPFEVIAEIIRPVRRSFRLLRRSVEWESSLDNPAPTLDGAPWGYDTSGKPHDPA